MITKGPKGQVYVWPSYRFGPGGQKRLFDNPGDVPAGWGRSPIQAKGGDLPPLGGMKRPELEAQAKLEGVDLSKIEGTGANGNVLVDDIIKAIEAGRN